MGIGIVDAEQQEGVSRTEAVQKGIASALTNLGSIETVAGEPVRLEHIAIALLHLAGNEELLASVTDSLAERGMSVTVENGGSEEATVSVSRKDERGGLHTISASLSGTD